MTQTWKNLFLALVLQVAGAIAPANAGQPAAPAAPATSEPANVQAAPQPVIANPDGSSDLVRGNAGQAVAGFSEALKDTTLANDRRAAILSDRAVAYTKLGQPKLALDDYNKAVQLVAESPAIYNNRGNLLLVLGQYGEAIKDFDRAVLLAPGFAAAYSNRANAELKLGKLEEAVQDFTKAIELLPQSAPPLSGRGLVHLATGKPHAAIRDFSRAVTADARFASAYRNRADARIAVGQAEEAIEDYSRAIAFDIANPEIYVIRGNAYLAANNTASAIKDFSRAIELDSSSVRGYIGRGLANGLADAYDDAYADLNRAIEIDPRSAAAFAVRAYVYKRNAQIDVGQRDIETAMKLDANNADVLWASGEIKEARGEGDAAIEDLRKSLTIRPNWRPASEALKRLGQAEVAGEEHEVKGLGLAPWRVISRGGAFFAESADFSGLRIPLEMTGTGTPKLLDWDVKKAPNKGYGVLRFSGGQVRGKDGLEDTELAAIVDLETQKVVAIQPHRQGARVANWTWEPARVQVASIDGVTDEYALRAVQPPPVAEAPAQAPAGQGERRTASRKSQSWSPWDEQGSISASPRSEPRPQRRVSQQKPKTLFDLLFNN